MQKKFMGVMLGVSLCLVSQAARAEIAFKDAPEGFKAAVLEALREPVREVAQNEADLVVWIAKNAKRPPRITDSLTEIPLRGRSTVEREFGKREPKLSNMSGWGAGRGNQTWGSFLAAAGGASEIDRILRDKDFQSRDRAEILSDENLVRLEHYDDQAFTGSISLPSQSRFYCNTELEVYLMDGMYWRADELTENCD